MLYWGLSTCAALHNEAQANSPQFLSASEQQRLQHLSLDQQRSRFICARYYLRQILIAGWGGELCDWVLSAEAGQAPRVLSQPHLHISLSHSGDYLLAAAATTPIGVDIEVCKQRRNAQAMAELICHPHEYHSFQQLESHAADHALLQYWTAKEAWLKQQGLGLDQTLMKNVMLQACSTTQANIGIWQYANVMFSLVTLPSTVINATWLSAQTPQLLQYACIAPQTPAC